MSLRPPSPPVHPGRAPQGFTLVEMIVAMGVLMMIMGLLFSIINQTSQLWRNTSGKISAFQEARTAFESITRNLSQATLNTYYDYTYDPSDTKKTNPIAYQRQSELHFICGSGTTLLNDSTATWSGITPVRPTHALFFQAPLGYISGTATPSLDRLLNAAGYYIEFNNDTPARPKFLRTRSSPQYRYRLMRITQSADTNAIYKYPASLGWPTSNGSNGYLGWFRDAVNNHQARPIASNIIALILAPKRSSADPLEIAPDYGYDSRNDPNVMSPSIFSGATSQSLRLLQKNQLPPMVSVTMVAIDEASASRLADRNGTTAPPLVSGTAFALTSNFSSGDFKNPKDLESLEKSLTNQGINYRVFSTNVAIRGAKWSND